MSIYVSIVIDADVAEVWATIEPIERHVDWMVDAETIRFTTDQRRGVGTRFTCDTRVGPIRLRDDMEIVSWVPEREMGVRHRGLVTGTGTFTLTKAANGGTLFAWAESLTFPWWLGGKLGEAIGGRFVLSAIWRRNLRRLKALVER